MSLTAREYAELTPEALGDGYTAANFASVGLPQTERGYGLLYVANEQGDRFTVATEDVDYHGLFVEANREQNDLGDVLEIPAGKYDRIAQGWPDEWPNGRADEWRERVDP